MLQLTEHKWLAHTWLLPESEKLNLVFLKLEYPELHAHPIVSIHLWRRDEDKHRNQKFGEICVQTELECDLSYSNGFDWRLWMVIVAVRVPARIGVYIHVAGVCWLGGCLYMQCTAPAS